MTESALLAGAKPVLAALGLKKRAGVHVYTAPLSDGFTAWVALNTGSGPGLLKLNPVVGVRHDEVEATVARCRGKEAHPFLPPTVQVPLKSLLPAEAARPYPQWVLLDDDPGRNERVWALLATEVDRYGFPWMRARSSLDDLVDALLRSESLHEVYSLPVALTMLGRAADASSYVDQVERALDAGQHPNGVSRTDYGPFAAAVRRMIEPEKSGSHPSST